MTAGESKTNDVAARIFEKWWRVLSVLIPIACLPAFNWAQGVDQDLDALRDQQTINTTNRQRDAIDAGGVAAEVRAMRGQLDQMRAELLQRLTRVEAKLDK